MAKGLRSKIKRHFRTVKRETLQQAPWQIEAEKKKQEILQEIIAAPKPSELDAAAGAESSMDGAEPRPSGMAVDGDAEEQPQEGGTGQAPGKLLKKLRKERLQKLKGIAKGHKKRSKPLAGANQFHKKLKGKKRR